MDISEVGLLHHLKKLKQGRESEDWVYSLRIHYSFTYSSYMRLLGADPVKESATGRSHNPVTL